MMFSAHVVLGGGDEALDALDVPAAVVLQDCPGAAGADVGAGVGLGEHHRGAPVAVDHVPGDLLVALGAVAVEDGREAGAGGVEVDRRVGAEHELGDRPLEAGGYRLPAELRGDLEPEPLGVHVALVRRREVRAAS